MAKLQSHCRSRRTVRIVRLNGLVSQEWIPWQGVPKEPDVVPVRNTADDCRSRPSSAAYHLIHGPAWLAGPTWWLPCFVTGKRLRFRMQATWIQSRDFTATTFAIALMLVSGGFGLMANAQEVPPAPTLSKTVEQPASAAPVPTNESGGRQTKKITGIEVNIKNKSEIDGQQLLQPQEAPLPERGSIAHSTGHSRDWGLIAYQWQPTGYAHSPLYFEEVNLERYGSEFPFPFAQAWISGMHFYTHIPLLPYTVAAQKPWEEKYVLGQ